MAPKVYWIQGSPPARAVMMVATNLNVGVENVTVNLFAKENWTPDFLKKNPAHTVPVLEDGDFIITDSHAILAYLVTVYGKDDSLYPKDPKKRAKVDSMLHFDSSALFVKGKNIVGPIFYKGATTIPEEKINSILESYASVEGFLGKTAWIALDQPTIADYSSITSLLFLDVIAPIDAKKFPKLTAWMKKCADLPSYQTVCMPGHNLVKGIIEEKFKALSLS